MDGSLASRLCRGEIPNLIGMSTRTGVIINAPDQWFFFRLLLFAKILSGNQIDRIVGRSHWNLIEDEN